VPFDPGRDAWHAPAQCVHAAGYVAALIACVLACGWPVPEDLAEMWNWFEAGHWPSGLPMSSVTCGPAGPEAADLSPPAAGLLGFPARAVARLFSRHGCLARR
jgi:hypothetical protein